MCQEIFHIDGPSLGGTFERSLIALRVDPDGIDEYDARHADPWPEIIGAIVASGFRNYSGFRRGSHVVYYGELHPDAATALEAIADTEVGERWEASFRGLITSDRDTGGTAALEVFHQD